ncbi:MAG: glycine/betaine/sarcosine/D-proline family reductase selenoprotein B [Anaerolineae bacterium]|nr:glycine/betaine/sarcosine/D-proline family reductase selenoprotein B [Anaerolineae bacterium]
MAAVTDVFDNREAWAAHFAAGWLAYYQQTGETKWDLYEHPRNRTAVGRAGITLSQSRLLFISSAGAYLPDQQPPYDAPNPLGDYDIRLIPSSTPLDQIAYAHTHYDHAAVDADPQVLMPLRHLEALVREKKIGALTENMISFMGYQPDVIRVLDETIPPILRAAKEQQADAALLVPS